MMENIIECQGWRAAIHEDIEDGCWYGVLLNTSDHVLFTILDIDHALDDFKEALDEYLEFCSEHNKSIPYRMESCNCKKCRYLGQLEYWSDYPNHKEYGWCCNRFNNKENGYFAMQLRHIDGTNNVCECFSERE